MGDTIVLLVEGNMNVRETLSVALCKNFKVQCSTTLKSTLDFIDKNKVDIIILDNNISDADGKDILIKLRKIGVNAPIIILNKDNNLKTKLDYFYSGADEYIPKPFSLGELEAKLGIISRRFNNLDSSQIENIKTSNLVLDKKERAVVRDGYRTIKLRRKEFEILEYLMINCNKTITRNSIANYVWSVDYKPWSNSVDVHIKNLRDKIDKPFKRHLIKTVHGSGYKLVNS